MSNSVVTIPEDWETMSELDKDAWVDQFLESASDSLSIEFGPSGLTVELGSDTDAVAAEEYAAGEEGDPNEDEDFEEFWAEVSRQTDALLAQYQ